ncbi:exodeoxyribonuclease VII large subunit, partial [Gemmatimonadota bacterium]
MRDGQPNFDLFDGDEEEREEPRTSPDTSASEASHSDEGDPPGGLGEPLGDSSVAPDPTGSDPDAAPAPDEPAVWTISQVNQAVRALLEESLPPLWVSGEVANWTRARSGHCYFTLKDEDAQLRCVMWRGEASRLPTDPDEGMTVRAFGALTLYEARG